MLGQILGCGSVDKDGGVSYTSLMEKMIVWNAGSRNGTMRADWLDVSDVNAAIATLEAVAGTKGDWEMNDFGGHDWWGLHGTFDGEIFTIYTHKSGLLKIGAQDARLDVEGLKTALMKILA